MFASRGGGRSCSPRGGGGEVTDLFRGAGVICSATGLIGCDFFADLGGAAEEECVRLEGIFERAVRGVVRRVAVGRADEVE